MCYNTKAVSRQESEYGGVAQLGERLGRLYSLSHGGMYLTRQPRGSHPFVESLDKSAFLIEYGGVAQLGEQAGRLYAPRFWACISSASQSVHIL